MRSDLAAIRHKVHAANNPVTKSGNNGSASPSPSTQSTAPVTTARVLTVNDLKKYIKRDQTLFPTLKDEKYQDS